MPFSGEGDCVYLASIFYRFDGVEIDDWFEGCFKIKCPEPCFPSALPGMSGHFVSKEVSQKRMPTEDFQIDPLPLALKALGIEGEDGEQQCNIEKQGNLVQLCNIVLLSGCVGPAL